jgi:hypothetical protein
MTHGPTITSISHAFINKFEQIVLSFSCWWQSKGNALQGVERGGRERAIAVVAEQKQRLDVHCTACSTYIYVSDA